MKLNNETVIKRQRDTADGQRRIIADDAQELIDRLNSLGRGESNRHLAGYSSARDTFLKTVDSYDATPESKQNIYDAAIALQANIMVPDCLGIDTFVEKYTGRKLQPTL